MGEDASAIRQEIEETRYRMGDTAEALGHKTDLPARAKDRAGSLADRVSGATPDSEGVKRSARRAVGVAQENPLGLAVAAAGAGFIAGMMIPSTPVEKRTIGPVSDQVKGQAVKTGQEALERGKEVAQKSAEAAVVTAQESGKEEAEGLRKSVKRDTSSSESSPKTKKRTRAKKPAASASSRTSQTRARR